MYDQESYDDLDALLASLEQQCRQDAKQTCPITDAPDAVPQPRFIDVYIIDHTDEEAISIIDSTLDTPMEQATPQQEEQEPQEDHEPPMPHVVSFPAHATRRPRWWLLVSIALAFVLLGVATAFYAIVLMQTPSATVTLVLQAHTLTTATIVHVVPGGHTDPTTNQLAGRVLPAMTMSEQETVPTSGILHQAAQAAHGVVTFYNAAPYSQTIVAGTLLTGTDGVSVVTEQDALLPAAVMPTEGQVTVAAHVTLVGPQGNIGAGAIYGACCRLDVFVANSAFVGGQDARTSSTVASQDVQGVVAHVTPSLLHSVQAAFQTQVQPTETLLTPLACTQQVLSAPSVGMEATTVSVTVNETCTGMAYTTQDLTTLAAQRATQDAVQQFGIEYTTTGIQTTITSVTPEAHRVLVLRVTSHSLWMTYMSDTQQHALKVMLAGKSKAQATTLLLHLAGVQSVSLTLTQGTTLPQDTTHIALLMLEPQE